MKKFDFRTRPFYIADIGANHDGDLQRALQLIELAKDAGADAAKFQNFIAPKIVSQQGFEKLNGTSTHQSNWSKSVFEVYQDASICQDWTEKLKEKCIECDIEYFTSPYDFDSVEHVDAYVELYKIGSGDITWIELIQHIASKNKPVLLATGASTMADVDRAVSAITAINKELVLMQCNTNYTVDTNKHRFVNLKVLSLYANRFPGVVLGLSDHTPGHATVCGAVALGATVIEKHFTDDNDRPGPDHPFAMNPISWRQMVDVATEVFQSLGDGIKRIEENETASRIVQQRSMHAKQNLPSGTMIQSEDFEALRPCPEDAIRPYEFPDLSGRILNRSLGVGDYLKQSDVT